MSDVFNFAEARMQAREVFNNNLIPSIKDYTFDDFERDLMCDLALGIEDNTPRIDINDMPDDSAAAIFMYAYIIDNGLRAMRNRIESDPTSTDDNQELTHLIASIVTKGAH